MAGIKAVEETKIGDTVTEAARPAADAAARLQTRQADGVLGALSLGQRAVRGAPRRGREAPPERCRLQLRARDLARARLRISLRLSRPAAHGDHPGAPRARVLPRPHQHRADRRLPRDQDVRRDRDGGEPGEAAAVARGPGDRRALHPRLDPHAGGVRRRGVRALRGKARQAARAPLHGREPGASSSTSCRSARSCSTSTIG